MSETVGDFILGRVHEWGARNIYGYPGDGINGLLGAFERQQRVRFIQVRHEEMAAFMACAHAKWTGEVGVCTATSGPGAIHLLNGLYDAKLDHQPVVAIVGDAYTRAQGGHDQQEVDLLTLFKDVAGEYVIRCNTPLAIRHQIDRAFRIAQAERTVTCVIVPADVQEEEAQPKQPHMIHTVHSGVGYRPPSVVPKEADLQAAADVLNAGSRVAMLVGAGALHATDEVIATADALGAGVAKALLGKAAVPDDIPYCTNSIGLLGTRPSWELMQGCDTLLMVGTAFPYANFMPEEGKARAVQIELEPRMANLKYPCEVALIGDSKETLQDLLPLLRRKEDRSWQQKIEGEVRDWWGLMDEQGRPRANGNGMLRPQGVFHTLSSRLPDGAILSSDSGSAATWFARHLRIRRGMKASLSGGLATMLPGVPYAISAKFAYPDRLSVALVGDGAMQMLGMNELITAAKFYREWADPRLVVLVLDNMDLNQVTWEQRVLAGDPKYPASQTIPFVDFARFAESIGLKGLRMERPEDVERVWDEALAADRPVVIDALVDPNEPPMPPHVTWEQARALAKSLIRGDEDRVRVAQQAMRNKAEEVLPRR
ncbi:MAG: thiamine pyrophosphate-requiring protein [Candidatus Dormibacteraeota bacterium]|nr:thiamine pyrophosphate-requiring protein [Candidatus Dormibacteraeota bacterium]